MYFEKGFQTELSRKSCSHCEIIFQDKAQNKGFFKKKLSAWEPMQVGVKGFLSESK